MLLFAVLCELRYAPYPHKYMSTTSHPSQQPPLVKTPLLSIPDLGLCKTTFRDPDNTIPTQPAAQIIDVPGSCLTEPASKQHQLSPPETDVPIEAPSHNSSETFGDTPLESSTREFMEVPNAVHSIDSQSGHSSDHVSPVSKPRFGDYNPAEFDSIVGHSANLPPLSTLKPSMKAGHNIRRCATRNCNGLIVPSSTCFRCVKCIKGEWTARKAKGLSLPNGPRSAPISILRHDFSEKGKQKSVSWADRQNEWISRIKRVRLKLPEQPPPSQSTDEVSLKPKVHTLSVSSQGFGTKSLASNRKETSLEYSCLWDSDLSELTESSDDSESETEASELYSSSSEETSDSEPDSELPKLIIRIPPHRPSMVQYTPTPVVPHPDRPSRIFTPYPDYRCQHELLADFHTRLSGFQDALTIHLLYRQSGNRNPRSIFGFEGQYSVVAPDWDLFGRRDSIESNAQDVKEQLAKLGVLEFEQKTAVTINDNGIFMHFLCVHRFYSPLGPFYAEQEPRIMYGELEIAILPDSSHHILPGQRFVIRFRLVG
ncbi:hypothetical protein AGABI1DRAFT_130565 [Agaricus bisporus var. burnettii JB137-S8]|uniref:Uncharacterized protein n=1 Tax=Agaricus bisporus var. burnettii (strain JB137-S8 / ATCC MYA-4627 / FGSC 10392) TaxID=597362 RepID=K5X1Z5_AGABU|nr:uncharacterized protein AGABI1DRAFT_130565 [Agaricus bisporus var. burnettii JB137-S8]EKM77148.1 hypothetical protein AGABI1DRAFT_130565 [Agaricus bisporus var. burnettii JB137-S8]